MGKEGSVAPKERVNITYKPATGDQQEEVELPLRIMMMGDYTGKADETPLEERKPINVDKDNFADVMSEQNLSLENMTVADKLSGEEGAEMNVNLKFGSLKDFTPEGVAEQVPELRQLMQLRNALTALKGPLGNIPKFRKKIQGLLGDDAARERLMSELGMGESGEE
ncbi:MAG: type VI secretion system contractile sheath small subunit [Sandaracinaceae bacterium]|nr:type VI secretion system contractile sheath small subunit [Sandaracinaceae bacterium]